MAVRFGTWNVRSLYRAGPLRTITRELFKYKLDLVGVQVVTEIVTAPNQKKNAHFYMERGMRTMSWVQAFLYIKESSQ
jgi:hypothetical protein